uniref:Multicopper-oxidase laccase-like protein n=1 Tax=Phakopsora pachyrhizi TaxID=170000 RepID=A0A0S1MJA6_PHAPC
MSLGLTIHWHGIYQNGTNWEDGVTGITQCPIPPHGGQYTYKFKITEQFGTFWYHAHQQNFMADGISGPFIVHSIRDPLKRSVDFDQEVVLFLADWYHNTSETIVHNMLTEKGYYGTPAAPSPNSALINGVGNWNCDKATSSEKCVQKKSHIQFNFVAGETIRFRLINGASHAMFYYSVDEHTLNVTEADATGVYGPSNIHRIKFHNGQRYSVMIKTNKKDAGKNFFMRAQMDSDCWAWVANDAELTALGIINLIDGSEKHHTSVELEDSLPRTIDWKDEMGGECADLNSSSLKPILPSRVPKVAVGTGTLANAFGFQVILTGELVPRGAASTPSNATSANGQNPSSNGSSPRRLVKKQVQIGDDDGSNIPNGKSSEQAGISRIGGPPPTPVGTIGKFFVNNITWLTAPYQPILHDLIGSGAGEVNQTRVSSVTFHTPEWYDLHIVNLDPALSHPYHLHAMDMHLVAQGKGVPNKETLSKLEYDTINPLRRDTIVIEPASFAVVRILTDIPGVWILHCHIGWHLAGGFASVVVVQPERIKSEFNIPEDNLELCEKRVGPLDQIEPGVRRRRIKRNSLVRKLKIQKD